MLNNYIYLDEDIIIYEYLIYMENRFNVDGSLENKQITEILSVVLTDQFFGAKLVEYFKCFDSIGTELENVNSFEDFIKFVKLKNLNQHTINSIRRAFSLEKMNKYFMDILTPSNQNVISQINLLPGDTYKVSLGVLLGLTKRVFEYGVKQNSFDGINEIIEASFGNSTKQELTDNLLENKHQEIAVFDRKDMYIQIGGGFFYNGQKEHIENFKQSIITILNNKIFFEFLSRYMKDVSLISKMGYRFHNMNQLFRLFFSHQVRGNLKGGFNLMIKGDKMNHEFVQFIRRIDNELENKPKDFIIDYDVKLELVSFIMYIGVDNGDGLLKINDWSNLDKKCKIVLSSIYRFINNEDIENTKSFDETEYVKFNLSDFN